MIRVLKQTYDEKMAMYMKLPKKQLSEMLIECNKCIDILNNTEFVECTEEELFYNEGK